MLRSKDFLLVIVGAVIFAFILLNYFPAEQRFGIIISPLAQGLQDTKNLIAEFTGSNLKEVVTRSLDGTHGTYAVVIKNLRTNETFTQNENRVYQPASLYKLWVMGTVYEFLEKGTITEDQILSRDVKELNDLFKINEEDAEETDGTVTMSVADALFQMITISHNYAALLLVSEVRNSQVTSFIKEEGFKNSGLGEPPKTTAADIALFFEKVYKGEIINSEYSKKMVDLLTQQKLNDRIPKYLPNGTKVAHKTGEIDGFKHDAGIIFAKDPILFVVLSESDSPEGAAERIAQLSRDVFNYFEKN